MSKIRGNKAESEKQNQKPREILYVEPADYFPPEIRKLFFEDEEEEEEEKSEFNLVIWSQND